MYRILPALFFLLHMPLLAASLSRWLSEPTDDAGVGLDSPAGHWFFFVYQFFLLLCWLGFGASWLVMLWQGRSREEALATDGRRPLTKATRQQLAGMDAVQIALRYQSTAIGLLDEGTGTKVFLFTVTTDQSQHDDVVIQRWFADRLGIPIDRVQVTTQGTGVSAIFQRRVTWVDEYRS